jgi:hypothetical protein
MANHNPPAKPFTGKNDPRINRKGRPKSFDAWRALLLEIAAEPAVQRDKENNVKRLVKIQIPLVKDGKPVLDEYGVPVMVDHYATNAEIIARQWMSDPKNQRDFVEGAFGKVPQPVEHTGKDGGPIQFDYDKLIENLTTRPASNSGEPGEN